jgi:chemotaxis protein CheD
MATLDIGNKNIDFVREYILAEHLKLISEDVGDVFPRKVMYFPMSGRAKVKKLRTIHNNTIVERETSYLNKLEVKPAESDIELF